VAASTGGIILEKFHHMPAFRTLCFKNGVLVPILGILSRTLHLPPSFKELTGSSDHLVGNLLYILAQTYYKSTRKTLT
jgi:hypothetical protein